MCLKEVKKRRMSKKKEGLRICLLIGADGWLSGRTHYPQ